MTILFGILVVLFLIGLLLHLFWKPKKAVVLFACTHNAGRSQIAAAFFNSLVDKSKAYAISAGTNPSDCVHPAVIETMRRFDIELSHVKPIKLTDELANKATLLITMGCNEACPIIPGKERLDWNIYDPKDKDVLEVMVICAYIHNQVMSLLLEKKWF